jgi:tetratricopeptide (TPR) repeat protein
LVCFRYILVIVLVTLGDWLFGERNTGTFKSVPDDSKKTIKFRKNLLGKLSFLSMSGILLIVFTLIYRELLSTQPSVTAYRYMKSGVLAYNSKDYVQAEISLKKAIAEDSEYAIAYFNLGRIYDALGKNNESISFYTKAIDLRPENECFYAHRGVAFRKEGNYQNALSDFNYAIDLNHRYAEAHNNRGVVFSKIGLMNRAIPNYSEAIRINPKFLMAYINRGIAFEKRADYSNAMRDYSIALRIDPRNAYVYQRRGNIFMFIFTNSQQACADWKRACELSSCEIYNNSIQKGICVR